MEVNGRRRDHATRFRIYLDVSLIYHPPGNLFNRSKKKLEKI